MTALQEIFLIGLALITAVTFHEYAHGRVADFLGDPTPRRAGRLSLNPLKHLDPLGTLMILIVRFGWGKPVPVNPNYFKDPRKEMMYVSLAGPSANFFLAFIIGAILRWHFFAGFFRALLYYTAELNIFLGVFNLIPLPPLDGSSVLAFFLPEKVLRRYFSLEKYGFLILFLLIYFLRPVFLSLILPPVNFIRYIFLPA